MFEVMMGECTRNIFCVDCTDEECFFHGKMLSDCPKYECDREDEFYEDCESCAFLKEFYKEMGRTSE